LAAFDALREAVALESSERPSDSKSLSSSSLLLFPTIRECNSALSSFGKDGDLFRALRMFGKMRKVSVLYQKYQSIMSHEPDNSSATSSNYHVSPSSLIVVPTPTLVTYSTLMSRAVQVHKPLVALRLWRLMPKSLLNDVDVRACNILMNAHAKLANVEAALDLLEQMKTGHLGLSATTTQNEALAPNLVTYNTVLDACLKAHDLDAALQVKNDMLENGKIRPDARTFTNLIATVARKSSQSAGINDPSLAFDLLDEMKSQYKIVPNGMTYSALIDAAGRCRRIDLALQGLRLLLQQKTEMIERRQQSNRRFYDEDDEDVIENEVGAWTAAISACGKVGRWETALRLFVAMRKKNVEPNTVTCGCLTDVLLRHGRTAETLSVLRYMKDNGIVPTEVMYTSLMTRAEGLLQQEGVHSKLDKRVSFLPISTTGAIDDRSRDSTTDSSSPRAIEVYAELMKSLLSTDESVTAIHPGYTHTTGEQQDSMEQQLLIKVFLVFQEMKAVGAKPDLACYNALLRACAKAGDVSRCQDVLNDMQAFGLDPNDTSWRQLINVATANKNTKLAVEFWKQGLSYSGLRKTRNVDEPARQWNPSVESFGALISCFLREAACAETDQERRFRLLDSVAKLYDSLILGEKRMGLDRIDLDSVLDSQRAMLLGLQAIVGSYELCMDDIRRKELSTLAQSFLKLQCFRDVTLNRLSRPSALAYQKALEWF